MLTGRIWTVDDIPLSEVNISFAETPYNVLAQTNVSGHFSTLGVCANGQQELLIAKDGFVPVELKGNASSATTATIAAKLEIAGKLQDIIISCSFALFVFFPITHPFLSPFLRFTGNN